MVTEDLESAEMSNGTEIQPYSVVMAVGSGYICTAAIIIPLHIICSYLMWQDKEMRNPTYQFMINLSVADSLELIPIGLYAGICILGAPMNEVVDRIMAYITLSAWYVNCIMFIFIAISRWISMTRHHLINKVFTKNVLIIMHISPWILFWSLYTAILWYHLPPFFFVPEFFTWSFAMGDRLGAYMYWHNFVFNFVCGIVEMIFNVFSLKWVHATRNTIMTTGVASVENRRRETKLLIQCCIIGFIFTMASILFTIVYGAGVDSVMGFLGMQCVWTFNHCVNPIVYLSVNSKLRRAFIRKLTCGRYGVSTKVGSTAVNVVSIASKSEK